MALRWPGFKFSERELGVGSLAYSGELVVDLGSRRIGHPVVLLYEADTPFRPPIVVPILTMPSGDDWRWNDVIAAHNRVRLPAGYHRHQMPQDAAGSLCLVEVHSEQEPEIIHGADLLWRALQVFQAIDLGRPFPYPDSETAELEAHFSVVGDILLPETFYASELGDRGRFWAVKTFDKWESGPTYIPQSPGHVRELLVGLHVDTTTAAGTLITDWKNTATDAVIRAFPFAANQNLSAFPRGDTDGRDAMGLQGPWWQLSGEPAPVWNGGELAAELERLTGVPDAVGLLADEVLLSAGKRECALGLRYPGRDGQQEWLFLLLLVVETPDRAAMKADPRNAMREAVRIARVGAFRVHPLRRQALELRNRDRVPPGLDRRKVLVLGCGALGADVAVALAKAGIGTLVLVDPDIVHSSNVVRHEAGLWAIGLVKPDAVRRSIYEHNPFVSVETTPRRAAYTLDDLEQALREADLVVSTIADENAEMVINAAAERVGRTVIYGRSLRRGTAARVFRVRPGNDACKECLARHHRDTKLGNRSVGYISVPPAEGEVLARECGQAVLAGSAIDLRFAANLTARAVLDELNGGVSWNNLIWVLEPWAGAPDPLDSPYGVVRQTLLPHPECTTCGRPRLHEIVLSPDAVADLTRLTEAKATVETGGALIGYEEGEKVHVVEVTDAGPNALETPTRFLYDPEYINSRLREAAVRLGERGQYVGEWHSHLEADPRPSALDVHSFTSLAECPLILTNEPAMVIMGLDPSTRTVGRQYAASFPLGRRMHALRVNRVGKSLQS
jgi:integrative and conjugative element protein (TIGR02256 family)